MCFSAYSSSSRVGANALWQVQHPSGVNFSNVVHGQGYCLQHLASGRYLSAIDEPGRTWGARAEPPAVLLSTM